MTRLGIAYIAQVRIEPLGPRSFCLMPYYLAVSLSLNSGLLESFKRDMLGLIHLPGW